MAGAVSPALILLVIGLLMLLGAIGVVLYSVAFGPRARLRKRMAAVVGAEPEKAGKSGKPGQTIQRKRNIQSKLKHRDDARQKKKGSQLREDLVQAGLTTSVTKFFVVSAIIGVLAALFSFVASMPMIVVLSAGLIGGLGLPRFYISQLKKRRLKKFTMLFADAIDVIVRSLKSGLPTGEAIALIGREMPDPVGTEFRLISESQRLGVTLDEALQKAVDRTPTPELKFFGIVLSIQQQTGGNLAETLTKLSDVLRQRKKMRDKVQAMSSEAKASASIIGSLPFAVGGLLGLVAPDYVGLLFTTDTGHMLLTGGMMVMGVGIFVMKQMINFDI